jgi:hypothetical protein
LPTRMIARVTGVQTQRRLAREESMHQPVCLREVLDAVGALSPDEQLALVDIVAHRLAEEGRKRVVFEFQQHEGNEAILLQSLGTHDEVY